MPKLRSFIYSFVCIVIIGITLRFIFIYQNPIRAALQNLVSAPCTKPITYRINFIDSRFNIYNTTLLPLLKQSSTVWSKAAQTSLFEYSATGTIAVNFIYDYRQQSTDTISKLGLNISNDKKSYDSLEIEYKSLNATYTVQKTQLENLILKYKSDEQNYNTDVTYWNKHGGAPSREYATLTQQKNSLIDQANNIKALENSINTQVENINALGTALNQIAKKINLNVSYYNNVGKSAPREFEEGEYIRTATSTSINIYQYTNTNELTRVLEHEFGHALGLQHVASQGSIMYAINDGQSLNLTKDDIAELDRICNSR